MGLYLLDLLELGLPYMVMQTSKSGRVSAVLYDYKETSSAQIRRRLPGCSLHDVSLLQLTFRVVSTYDVTSHIRRVLRHVLQVPQTTCAVVFDSRFCAAITFRLITGLAKTSCTDITSDRLPCTLPASKVQPDL